MGDDPRLLFQLQMTVLHVMRVDHVDHRIDQRAAGKLHVKETFDALVRRLLWRRMKQRKDDGLKSQSMLGKKTSIIGLIMSALAYG